MPKLFAVGMFISVIVVQGIVPTAVLAQVEPDSSIGIGGGASLDFFLEPPADAFSIATTTAGDSVIFSSETPYFVYGGFMTSAGIDSQFNLYCGEQKFFFDDIQSYYFYGTTGVGSYSGYIGLKCIGDLHYSVPTVDIGSYSAIKVWITPGEMNDKKNGNIVFGLYIIIVLLFFSVIWNFYHKISD